MNLTNPKDSQRGQVACIAAYLIIIYIYNIYIYNLYIIYFIFIMFVSGSIYRYIYIMCTLMM